MPTPKSIAFLEAAIAADTDACIPWPFYVKKGYGRFTMGGKNCVAHVFACRAVHGPAPTLEHQVAHLCGLKCCVNPRHLLWSTQSENIMDEFILGRKRPSRMPTRRRKTEVKIALRLPAHAGMLPDYD